MRTRQILAVIAAVAAAALASASALAQTNNAGQARRGRFGEPERGVYRARLVPHWFAADTKFWYRNDLRGGAREFILVDAEKGNRQRAFDHDKLAAALSKAANHEYKGDHLPISSLEFSPDARTVRFEAADKTWECDLEAYSCKEKAASGGTNTSSLVAPDEPVARTGPADGHLLSPAAEDGDTSSNDDADNEARGQRSWKSPDGKWTASVRDGNLFVRSQDGTERQLSQDGTTNHSYGLIEWSPESDAVVAWRIEPGDHKEVFNIESSPSGGERAKLHRRPYAQAGDKFTQYELNLFDVATGKQTRPEADRYEHEWEPPRPHWLPDKRRFAYEQVDRGHQRLRVIAVDSHTGAVRNLVDEKAQTFIWTAHTEVLNINYVNWLDKSGEMIYVSERDGWRHLYLIDTKDGTIKNQITKGPWVVRALDRIDEDARQVWFRAGGVNAGQDPYFIQFYRVNFDGTGLTALTEGDGNHTAQYSGNRKYLIDTYSRVDLPPVHRLRRTSDGSLVCELEKADISELKESGWQPPEVFVAKGRDGETDIWGIICRPKNFDPGRKYPVLEQIYAGPQAAYVPKSFSGAARFASLTDLGFIVVQIDAMGTAFRSKAFHDVCWHNLKDAGFPDRILWHRAVAAKYPSYDISRVGIFGTSAGGQSAAGAVLFHPDFYKAAVANSGCHDNRLDKASWNEQWMGYPVGPQYAECSNIDNAWRLKGKLFLIVGEMDSNVPPESTLRFVDALIRARKDFDLLVVPGAEHGIRGAASAYAERRMRDFFVHSLLEKEPPDHNGVASDSP
ncbi:MAG: prolyl oligopeptidase family serine peptidase [Verrucomicrobiota bacterium]